MQVKHVRTFNLSWKNVFNGDLKYLPRWGNQQSTAEGAHQAGYQFYTWNGWVFETTSKGSTNDRLIECQKLDSGEVLEELST